MKGLTLVFLLVLVPVLAQSFPASASQGGNGTLKLFYCKDPGCAAEVTKVFCNDELLADQIHMADCAGRPPPDTVCQRGGRAFVSAEGDCEFEAKARQIQTETCADDSSVCEFPTAISTASTSDGGQTAGDLRVVCAVTTLILKLRESI